MDDLAAAAAPLAAVWPGAGAAAAPRSRVVRVDDPDGHGLNLRQDAR